MKMIVKCFKILFSNIFDICCDVCLLGVGYFYGLSDFFGLRVTAVLFCIFCCLTVLSRKKGWFKWLNV